MTARQWPRVHSETGDKVPRCHRHLQRALLVCRYGADGGALLENLVFAELAKTVNPLLDTLQYWRSKAGAEVDTASPQPTLSRTEDIMLDSIMLQCIISS